MSTTKENISLEMEQIKLERLKVYGKILTVLITVGLGTFAVSLINYSYQKRQLEQQELINKAKIELQEKQANADLKLQDEKAKAERRQAEMKYLGDYLKYALEDDIYRRLRFAGYFAALTISADLKENWKYYHATLKSSAADIKKREAELTSAKKTGDTKLITKLKGELDLLKEQERAFTPFRRVKFPIIRDMKVGESKNLEVKIWDETGRLVQDPNVEWHSQTPKIAEVSSDGLLKAKAPGRARITTRVTFEDRSRENQVSVFRVYK